MQVDSYKATGSTFFTITEPEEVIERIRAMVPVSMDAHSKAALYRGKVKLAIPLSWLIYNQDPQPSLPADEMIFRAPSVRILLKYGVTRATINGIDHLLSLAKTGRGELLEVKRKSRAGGKNFLSSLEVFWVYGVGVLMGAAAMYLTLTHYPSLSTLCK